MNREWGSGLFIAVLLAMMGVFYANVQPGGAGTGGAAAGAVAGKPDGKTGQTAARSQCLEGSEPVKALCRFLGDANLQVEADPGKGWGELPWVQAVRAMQVEILIATVPDPENTRLSLYFDRSISSIQAAVASAGWRFDRAWLPWKASGEQQANSLPEEGDAERLPGVLLFRGKKEEPAVVFLIGESPVSGIRRPAFRAAMEIIDVLCLGAGVKVRIAGPNFSGSFRSLREEILAVSGSMKESSFLVYSPNTTVRDAQESFVKGVDKKRIEFRRVLSDDKGALTAFANYLNEHWGRPPLAAFVAEGQTVYGLQGQGQKEDPANPLLSPDHTYNFTREMALLRNLYPDAARQTFGGGEAAARQGGAELKLKSGGRPTVPIFAEQQTVTSYEAQLLQIAQALDRGGYELAGLAATDVLDMIYVGGYLRRAAPDTRLYLLDSDLLLVRATSSLALDGTMLLTDFPLVLENREWTGWKERTPYASRWEVATFNAVRALLLEGSGEKGPLLEYSDPFDQLKQSPPMWLTVVSHDSLWPLATFREEEEGTRLQWADRQPEAENKMGVGRPSLAWEVLTALLAVMGIAFGAVLMAACNTALRRSAEWLEMFCFVREGCGRGGRAFYLLSMAALLMGMIHVQLTPLLAVGQFRGKFWIHLILPGAAMAMLLVVIAGILTKVGPAFFSGKDEGGVESPELRRAFGRASVAMLGAFVLHAAGWIYCFRWQSAGSRGEVFFRAYRSLEVFSGVSPALPVLVLGFSLLLLLLMYFRRYVLFAGEHPFLPEAGDDAYLTRLTLADGPLQRLISWPYLGAREIPVAALSVLAITYVMQGPQSVESRGYDWLYMVTLAMAVVFSVQAWQRFLLIWKELKVMLESLESHPLRETFNALPPEFSEVPLFGGSNRYRTNVVFCRSIDLLRALKTGEKPPAEVIAETPHFDVQELERKLRLYLGPDADVPESAMAGHRSIQHELRLAASELFAALGAHWAKGHSAREGAVQQTKEEGWLSLAEEFVALRYASYVRYTMLHLRNLLAFLTGGFFFTLISCLVYPFRSQNLLGWVATASLLALGAPVVVALFQMDRDPLLARLRSKEGGTGGAHFLLKAAVYALPALAALAGTHFPGMGRFFSNFMAPAVKALAQ